MPKSIYDPLLADKLFDVKSYQGQQVQREEEDILRRIKTDIYGDSAYSPLYYQAEHTAVALNAFVESPLFSVLQSEIGAIIQYLNHWLEENAVMVLQKLGGEEQFVPASRPLTEFFSRLKAEVYADEHIILYASGKVYLEKIAVLLRDESISMEARKAIIINLLSDNGLLHCAKGCYTRLMRAAEQLQSALETKNRLARWINDYLLETAEKLTISSFSGQEKTYVQTLCDKAAVPFEDYHIHARNYFLSKAVSDGKLPLNVPIDDIQPNFTEGADSFFLVDDYLNALTREISTLNLASYLADRVRVRIIERMAKLESYSELSEVIQLELTVLGRDDGFYLGEVLSEEGSLKATPSFQLSIIERLFHEGWLNHGYLLDGLDQPGQYRLFKDNFSLAWAKGITGKREPLIDLVKTRENLEILHSFWNAVLDFEHSQETLFFVSRQEMRQEKPFIEWPGEFSTKLFHYILYDMQLRNFNQWDLRTVYFGRIEEMILLKSTSLNPFPRIFQGLDFSEANLERNRLSNLDFSGSIFKRANLRGVLLERAFLKKVNFLEANLDQARLTEADLTGSNLERATLNHANLRDVELKFANLKNADLYYANLEGADLSHADLEGANFKKTNLEGAALVGSILRGTKLEGANLQGANLIDANLEGAHFDGAVLEEAKFTEVESRAIGADHLSGKPFFHKEKDRKNRPPKRKTEAAIADITAIVKRLRLKPEKSLEEATAHDNYDYPLQQHDVMAVVNLKFKNKLFIRFDVISSSNTLALSLDQFMGGAGFIQGKGNRPHPLTLLVDSGNQHWVTLLVFRTEDRRFSGYYIDSLGQAISSEIEQILEEKNIYYTELLKNSPQHDDAGNSALWALENAESLNGIFQNDDLYETLNAGLSDNWIRAQLEGTYRIGKEYFNEGRRRFSRMLLRDPARQVMLTTLDEQKRATTEGLALGNQCLSRHRRRRELNECLFSWEDVDRFNREKKHIRRIDKIVIDSAIFFDYLSTLDDAKRSQLLQFVESREMSGDRQNEVKSLISYQRIDRHFKTLKAISRMMLHGVIAKDTLAAFVREDAYTVAVNLGFIGVGITLQNLAEAAMTKGISWIKEGKQVLGQSLRASAPFLRRGTSLWVAYDFVQQLKSSQQKDRIDTIANLVGDGTFLGIDILDAGIEIVEMAGLIAGISSVVGPIGETVGVFVMLGTQIYQGVRTVERLDHWVHLSAWERFKEGSRAFLGLPPEAYLQEMADLLQAYDRLLTQKWQLLEKYSDIKHYVFPALEEVNAHCRSVRQEKLCSGYVLGNCYFMRTECHAEFLAIANSTIHLRHRQSNFKWANAKPLNPTGSEFLCLPTGHDRALPQEGAFRCDGAIGISDTAYKSGNTTLFALGEGHDYITGFLESPSIFIVNNGFKKFYGGEKNDLFIVKAQQVEGDLNGEEGIDILDISGFQPLEKSLILYVDRGYMIYGDKTLGIFDIEQFSGRSLQAESIIAACHTQQIDMQGGEDNAHRDSIIIPRDDDCFYDLKSFLRPHTNLLNQATAGNFTYVVSPGQGTASLTLPLFEISSQHLFLFNSTLSDLRTVSLQAREEGLEGIPQRHDIHFNFLLPVVKETLKTIYAIAINKEVSQSKANIDYYPKSKVLLDRQKENKFPRFLSEVQCRLFLKSCPGHFESGRFSIMLLDKGEIHFFILGLIDQGDSSSLIENFSLNINAGVSISTARFYLKDGIELKIGLRKNIYAYYSKANHTLSYLIHTYPAIARRLNMTFFLSTAVTDYSIVIGHHQQEVIHNDPWRESHLLGNGGHNLFVIDAGRSPLNLAQLPLPKVTIYYHEQSKGVDTIDLRPLVRQVTVDFNVTITISLIVHRRNVIIKPHFLKKEGSEVSEKNTPLILICLKEAWITAWYKRVHIILDKVPMKIGGRVSLLYLRPVPLKFEASYRIISLGVEDVERYMDIIIDKVFGRYVFIRDNDHLIVTNALDTSLAVYSHCSILLRNFYQEEKLSTLSIKFRNKKIVLEDKLPEIKIASDWNDAWDRQKQFLYADILQQRMSRHSNQRYAEAIDGYSLNNITANFFDTHARGDRIKWRHRSRRSMKQSMFFHSIKPATSAASSSYSHSILGGAVAMMNAPIYWLNNRLLSEKNVNNREDFLHYPICYREAGEDQARFLPTSTPLIAIAVLSFFDSTLQWATPLLTWLCGNRLQAHVFCSSEGSLPAHWDADAIRITEHFRVIEQCVQQAETPKALTVALRQ